MKSRTAFGALFALVAVSVLAVGCEEDDLKSSVGPAGKRNAAAQSDASPSASNTNSNATSDDSVAANRRKPSRGLVDATFDDIKLDLEKDEPFQDAKLTPEVEQLFGERIRIRGYMLPSFQQSGLTQFILVRDNQECCFGPGAALYDCIVVDMVPGTSADYSVRPVTIEGAFTLNPIVDIEGKHLAIYHLDGESVE